MKKAKDVKRFARMFMNAVGIDDMPAALRELQLVKELMSGNKEFRTFLENPIFSPEEREKTLKLLAGKAGLSDTTVRLILVLSDERIVTRLPDLINVATSMYLEKKKKAKAVVMTPVQFDKGYEERLRAALRNLTGRDADIEYMVDPSLLGGILVKVGSTMYDSSIRGQLRLLKDDLTKG